MIKMPMSLGCVIIDEPHQKYTSLCNNTPIIWQLYKNQINFIKIKTSPAVFRQKKTAFVFIQM